MPKSVDQIMYGKSASTFLTFISILIFVCFVTINLGMVFSSGVCCGDDAYFAVVAKNLANGLGYSSSFYGSTSYTLQPFDTGISTGPTIILPASLIIKLFGNTYWAPGLTIVAIWSTLLIMIGKLIFKQVPSHINFLAMVLVFFFYCLTFFPYHFEHWYSLLGEVPSALFIILGILVYFDKSTKGNLLLTGLLFSLAVQSKQIALLPFITFIVFVNFITLISDKLSIGNFIKSSIESNLFIFLGFIAPIFLFEIWRYISLGFNGYVNYLLEFFSFFVDKGVGGTTQSWELISSRVGLLKSRFGISLPIVIIFLSLFFFEVRKDKKLLKIYSVIFTIVIVYSIYWIFFSIGWARYYIICLILIIFCLIFPLFLKNTCKKISLLYLIVLVTVSIINFRNLNLTHPFQGITLFTRSASSASSEIMVDLLSTQLDKKPFITQWWATAADLEYLLPSYSNFTTYHDQTFDFEKQFVIAVDSRLLAPDEDFEELLEGCKTYEVNRYIYGLCEPIKNEQ